MRLYYASFCEERELFSGNTQLKDLKLHFIFHQTFKTKLFDDFDSSILNTFNSNRFSSPNVSDYKTILSLYSSSESGTTSLSLLILLK